MFTKPGKFLMAGIVCAGMVAQATPQSERQSEAEAPKFSVQSQLVEVFATVTRGKLPVPNLSASDFQVSEDGNPVAIDRVDRSEVPLQIALLVDISESIQESLKTIQDAAIAFIDSLNFEDRVVLILFNSDIRSFQQTTEDREPVLREIRNAKARGMTRLYEALLLAMKYLEGKSGRKAIVCFTDGEDTASTITRSRVLNAAAHHGYPIYMIGAGAGLGLSRLQIILSELSQINGGKAFFISSLRRLRDAFTEVASELRSAYVLNYYTQLPPDDRWHEITVKTKDPALTVNARKGFFARKP